MRLIKVIVDNSAGYMANNMVFCFVSLELLADHIVSIWRLGTTKKRVTFSENDEICFLDGTLIREVPFTEEERAELNRLLSLKLFK